MTFGDSSYNCTAHSALIYYTFLPSTPFCNFFVFSLLYPLFQSDTNSTKRNVWVTVVSMNDACFHEVWAKTLKVMLPRTHTETGANVKVHSETCTMKTQIVDPQLSTACTTWQCSESISRARCLLLDSKPNVHCHIAIIKHKRLQLVIMMSLLLTIRAAVRHCCNLDCVHVYIGNGS